jgi:hypothetical protein
MRIGWPIDIQGCVKRLARASRSSITNQCHVITKLHADAGSRFYTSVSYQANDDDFLLAMALELVVEVGIREAARSPVLRCNDIARMHLEVVMERTAPGAFGKDLVLCSLKLIRRRILPVLVIACSMR